jgi:hypothetical protein
LAEDEKRPEGEEERQEQPDEEMGDIDADLAVLLPRTEETDTGLEIKVSGRNRETRPVVHPAEEETQSGLAPPVIDSPTGVPTPPIEPEPDIPPELKPGPPIDTEIPPELQSAPPPPPPPQEEDKGYDFQVERPEPAKEVPRPQVQKQDFDDLMAPTQQAGKPAVPTEPPGARRRKVATVRPKKKPVADRPPPPPPEDVPIEQAFPKPLDSGGSMSEAVTQAIPGHKRIEKPPPDLEPEDLDLPGGLVPPDVDEEQGVEDIIDIAPDEERDEIPLEAPLPLAPEPEEPEPVASDGLGMEDVPLADEVTIPLADDEEAEAPRPPGESTEELPVTEDGMDFDIGGDPGVVDQEMQDFMGGGQPTEEYPEAEYTDPSQQVREYGNVESRDIDTPYSKEELENLFSDEPPPVPPWERPSARVMTPSGRVTARKAKVRQPGKLLLLLILILAIIGVVGYVERDWWMPRIAKPVVKASKSWGIDESVARIFPALYKMGEDQIARELDEQTRPPAPPPVPPPEEPPEEPPEPEPTGPDPALVEFLETSRESEAMGIPAEVEEAGSAEKEEE